MSAMPLPVAIRYVVSSAPKTNLGGTVYLQCFVKPGAAKSREGITRVTDESVEVCVAARPRDGEANEAVIAVLSKVLGVRKSHFQLTHGAKSREKTITVSGLRSGVADEDVVEHVRKLLVDAMDN